MENKTASPPVAIRIYLAEMRISRKPCVDGYLKPAAASRNGLMNKYLRGGAAEVFVHQAIAGRRSRLEAETVRHKASGKSASGRVKFVCKSGGDAVLFSSQSENVGAHLEFRRNSDSARRPGVSVYGFGGWSAHDILEEYIGHRAIHAAPPRWAFSVFK